MIRTIKQIFENAKFESLGRSCDLLWFNFVKNEKDIVLNTQCFIRIIFDNKVITTKDDIYISMIQGNKEFNWEMFGGARYDMLALNYLKGGENVKYIKKSDTNDIEIHFDNELIIQLLVTGSEKKEMWRVIYDNKHYVMRDKLLLE